jgi:hypothetical protein
MKTAQIVSKSLSVDKEYSEAVHRSLSVVEEVCENAKHYYLLVYANYK